MVTHCVRNCLLKYIIEGKRQRRTKLMGRRGRICKQLLDDLNEKKGYWKFKKEALDRALRNTRFGKRLRTCRKTDYRMNE